MEVLQDPRTPLYHVVKHFHLQAEDSNIFSLPVLQAAILLALYELGHAVYPAVFLSVRASARYAHALGISLRDVEGIIVKARKRCDEGAGFPVVRLSVQEA